MGRNEPHRQRDAGVLETLGDVFGPLYPGLLALFLSHGISFFTNFLRRREYAGRDPSDQMKEPYKRIVVMHVSMAGSSWPWGHQSGRWCCWWG